MTWPKPFPGLVIRYSYLWSNEARSGREEGLKDRPCAVVIILREEAGRQRVRVLPITHSPPKNLGDALEMPSSVKRMLAFDDAPSWIVVTESNDFWWPGPDLRPVISDNRSAVYGVLPPRFFSALKARLIERKRHSPVSRTE